MERSENPMPKEELLEIEGPDLIRRGMTPKRTVLREHQAAFMARLIREMESALIRFYGVRMVSEIRWNADQHPTPWECPEVMRFLEGAVALGFVSTFGPEEFQPLGDIHQDPSRWITSMGPTELRRYIHTLHRADKAADGLECRVLEALACGALQLVANRLESPDLQER